MANVVMDYFMKDGTVDWPKVWAGVFTALILGTLTICRKAVLRLFSRPKSESPAPTTVAAQQGLVINNVIHNNVASPSVHLAVPSPAASQPLPEPKTLTMMADRLTNEQYEMLLAMSKNDMLIAFQAYKGGWLVRTGEKGWGTEERNEDGLQARMTAHSLVELDYLKTKYIQHGEAWEFTPLGFKLSRFIGTLGPRRVSDAEPTEKEQELICSCFNGPLQQIALMSPSFEIPQHVHAHRSFYKLDDPKVAVEYVIVFKRMAHAKKWFEFVKKEPARGNEIYRLTADGLEFASRKGVLKQESPLDRAKAQPAEWLKQQEAAHPMQPPATSDLRQSQLRAIVESLTDDQYDIMWCMQDANVGLRAFTDREEWTVDCGTHRWGIHGPRHDAKEGKRIVAAARTLAREGSLGEDHWTGTQGAWSFSPIGDELASVIKTLGQRYRPVSA